MKAMPSSAQRRAKVVFSDRNLPRGGWGLDLGGLGWVGLGWLALGGVGVF